MSPCADPNIATSVAAAAVKVPKSLPRLSYFMHLSC